MLSLICNRASICKQSVKALMGISAEFYSDKIDINFIDVNAKSLWPFSTFVNQVLKFYPHFACSERLRKFPIKYGDLYICGRGVRKLPVQYLHRNHCCIWLVIFRDPHLESTTAVNISSCLIIQTKASIIQKSKRQRDNQKSLENLSLVMRKPVFAVCEQQRRRSACASAQSDQRLCCSLPR